MRSPMLIAWLACTAACAAPADEPVLECQRGEIESVLRSFPQHDDVVVIVDDALVPVATERVRALLRTLVTGDVDGDGIADNWVAPEVRLSVLRLSLARPLFEAWPCEHLGSCAPAPFVRYRWAPYGFADELEPFVAAAMCPLNTSNPFLCPWAAPGDEPPLLRGFTRVFLITHQELCGPFEVGSCSSDLARLVTALNDNEQWSLELSVIAGFPPERATIEAFQSAPFVEDYFRALTEAPVAGEGSSSVCEVAAGVSAAHAPELLEELAPVLSAATSVCAPDYRPVTSMEQCGGAIDFVELGMPERVLALSEGTYECELELTLPEAGPITRCEQLLEHGYFEWPLRGDGTREVCGLPQIWERDAEHGAGFYLTRSYSGNRALPWIYPGQSPCIAGLGGVGLLLRFGASIQGIPGADVRLRCATAAVGGPSC